MEGNWELKPPDMWTCPQLNTGGNYTVPSGKYSYSPEGCLSIYTVSSYRGPQLPNGKSMFFILAGTFLHTHTMGPLLTCSVDSLLYSREHQITALYEIIEHNLWRKRAAGLTKPVPGSPPDVPEPPQPGGTHQARQWSEEAPQNRNNKCRMFSSLLRSGQIHLSAPLFKWSTFWLRFLGIKNAMQKRVFSTYSKV